MYNFINYGRGLIQVAHLGQSNIWVGHGNLKWVLRYFHQQS
jgi:hypothetical protein